MPRPEAVRGLTSAKTVFRYMESAWDRGLGRNLRREVTEMGFKSVSFTCYICGGKVIVPWTDEDGEEILYSCVCDDNPVKGRVKWGLA